MTKGFAFFVRAACALVVACAGGGGSAPHSAAPESGASQAPASQTPAATGPAPTAVAATPPAEPVDLLRAVRADVAVSSVYHDERQQAVRLVDGDPETAWNSRSGDLAGAWIEVRLPPSASVTAVAMTAGFTHRTASSDLFTGNHRVKRIRILREGAEVAVRDLDPEVRDLQTLPAEGAGGVWRIEIVETVPGTHADWREVCVSELRVLGRDAGQGGAHFPRVAAGALPAPLPPLADADRADVASRFASTLRTFGRAWTAFDRLVRQVEGSAVPDEEGVRPADFVRARRAVVASVVDLVAPIDDVRASALRAVDAHVLDWSLPPGRVGGDRETLETSVAALDAVARWLGDDPSRCVWARAHADLRVERIKAELEVRRYLDEISEFHDGETMSAQDRQNARRVERAAAAFPAIAQAWRRAPAAAAPRLRAFEFPESCSYALPDWNALRALLEAEGTRCGW